MSMDEITTGGGRSLERPIHRACVVAACWCREASRAVASTNTRARKAAKAATAAVRVDLVTWRSVGLPVA